MTEVYREEAHRVSDNYRFAPKDKEEDEMEDFRAFEDDEQSEGSKLDEYSELDVEEDEEEMPASSHAVKEPDTTRLGGMEAPSHREDGGKRPARKPAKKASKAGGGAKKAGGGAKKATVKKSAKHRAGRATAKKTAAKKGGAKKSAKKSAGKKTARKVASKKGGSKKKYAHKRGRR